MRQADAAPPNARPPVPATGASGPPVGGVRTPPARRAAPAAGRAPAPAADATAPARPPAAESGRRRTTPPSRAGRARGVLVAVGPGSALPQQLSLEALGLTPVNPLPVRASKIQPPPPRSDTLSRTRLNSWLDRAARGRLALIIGEAGFGKTTLLADWAEHSRRATAWYGLEHDDRDWLTFVRHLVAGAREVDGAFGPETYRLLSQLGSGGPTREEVTTALAREMAAFGDASPGGFSVILDDFHEIERSEETDPVVAALLGATGAGFSLLVAARSTPELPTVPMRGRNAVHRLENDDLRFNATEIEELFIRAYGIPLESDVATDLASRTEGWAALLSLVRARIEERADSDPRTLVAQLNVTQGDLYDFLAGEVLADLPPGLLDFLMAVSILTHICVRCVTLIDDRDRPAIEKSLAEAERLGLLIRTGRDAAFRLHSPVRQILMMMLEAKIGQDELRQRHRRLAEVFETSDWHAAATHYRAAGDPTGAARVVDGAIPLIIASGAFESLGELLDGTAGPSDRPGALILRSRVEQGHGNLVRALTLAELAVQKAQGALLGTAQLNLAALEGIAGYPDHAIQRTERALSGELAEIERRVAEASRLVSAAQTDADLEAVADALRDLARQQEFADLKRYASISYINLAVVLNWIGNPRGALKAALRAETGFDESTGSVERVSALVARAKALTQLRKIDEADRVLGLASISQSSLGRIEANIEAALIYVSYASLHQAKVALERVDAAALPAAYLGVWSLVNGLTALREGNVAQALSWGSQCQISGMRDVAGKFQTDLLLLRAHLASEEASDHELTSLARLADSLGSAPARRLVGLLRAMKLHDQIGGEVASLSQDDRHVLSVIAEELVGALPCLSASALEVLHEEVTARPERWRPALRAQVKSGGPAQQRAASLLGSIGNSDDAHFLRQIARSVRSLREIAIEVSHRVAPRVKFEDLGVVGLRVDGRPIGRSPRRKSMALLCFLASRPRQAATRDEVVEALWPDSDPETGINSLHQAIYHVRRLFDPQYREGLSAGYLTFDGEIIALNSDLVKSASDQCWTLLRTTTADDQVATDEIISIYRERFALDFMYEDWASAYRDTLHAAVLSRLEASVSASISRDDPEAAIRLATEALALDPSADAIELQLLRAYKAAGRHAAAGEQYAHYATVLRDELGVNPPAFHEI